jgi:Ca2+-binding EF-hand superfamily protein
VSERTILDIKLDQSFDMLDTDRDGRICEDDLVSLATRLSEVFHVSSRVTVNRLRDAFAVLWAIDLGRIPVERDGVISRDQWRDGIRRAVSDDRSGFLDRMGAMVQAWLALCDGDNDGRISREEYITMYSKTLGLSSDRLDEAFTALDTNDEGTLGWQEVRIAVEEYYTSEERDTPGNWLFGPL